MSVGGDGPHTRQPREAIDSLAARVEALCKEVQPIDQLDRLTNADGHLQCVVVMDALSTRIDLEHGLGQAGLCPDLKLIKSAEVVVFKEQRYASGDLADFGAARVHLQVDATTIGLPLLCPFKVLDEVAVNGMLFLAFVEDDADVGVAAIPARQAKAKVPMSLSCVDDQHWRTCRHGRCATRLLSQIDLAIKGFGVFLSRLLLYDIGFGVVLS